MGYVPMDKVDDDRIRGVTAGRKDPVRVRPIDINGRGVDDSGTYFNDD